MNRGLTPPPGFLKSEASVFQIPLEDRFVEMLRRTMPYLPGEMREEFAMMLTPSSLAIIAGTMVVWAGSHYFGVGFVVDAILLIAGAVFLGIQVLGAARDFVTAIELTVSAKSNSDLDQAARHLANFIAVVGVAAFLALVFKGAKKVAPKARSAVASAATTRTGGIASKHFRAFQDVARETNRIIGVRNTNPLSIPWIERGFPGKPMFPALGKNQPKTSKTTGIVIAEESTQVKEIQKSGYYVVESDGVARNVAGQELKFTTQPDWPVEPGQVIHPGQQKPLVGDYDLLGVIDPNAKGRNLVLAASNGKRLDDWSNPDVRRVADALNSRMDQPRVLHGAHDGYYGAKPNLSDAGGSTVFFPDGEVRNLTTSEEVAAFYRDISRKPISGTE